MFPRFVSINAGILSVVKLTPLIFFGLIVFGVILNEKSIFLLYSFCLNYILVVSFELHETQTFYLLEMCYYFY